MWKDKKTDYSPPPLTNFAYKHFFYNNSEYFAVVGHQISGIILGFFILNAVI